MPDVVCGSADAPPDNLLVVSPGDPEHLLAACGFGDICETRDDGTNWAQHPLHGGAGGVTSIAFLDERTAVLVKKTYKGTTFVLRSSDGGTTWDIVHESPDAIRVIASKARPATVFLMHGVGNYFPNLNRSLSRSDDGGVTWNAVSSATAPIDLKVTSIVDAPGGGFLVTTRYGLARFD
jgi:photosystem II stability/assembly factor-like uncharacterized protein